MPNSGGGSQTVTQQVQYPSWVNEAAKQNLALADAIADRDFPGYGNTRLASFTPDEAAGFQTLRGAVGNNLGFGHGVASDIAKTFSPRDVEAAQAKAASIGRGNIRDVAAERFTDADLSSYLNPHTGHVVRRTLGDMTRTLGQTQSAARARSMAAHAFGGSRGTLLEAENNRNFFDAAGRAAAQLRAQGFDRAAGLQQADAGRALQAGISNQGMDWNAASQNASMAQQASLENARLRQQAELANQQADIANAQTRLAATAQMGTSANQRLGKDLTAGRTLAEIGRQQRGMDQANMDIAYDDFLRQSNYPIDMLNLRLSTLSGTPYGSTTTQTTPIYRNTGASLLGGASTGASVGGQVGGPAGAGYGAALGALLGLLG